MTPRVTVLMAMYNGVSYLQEAIESVLSQTLADFEFLIIDDASTDDSVAYVQKYNDPRIRLIRNEENMGQVRSLNKGLAIAQGEYIARLDQDDVCLPERLQEQVVFLQKRPDVAVICSWEHTIDEYGRKIRSWRREIKNYGAYLGILLIGKCPVWHPSVMFRRQIVAELGGYNPSFQPSEDFDLWSRIAMRRYNAAIVPKFLLLQRRHGAQQTAGNRKIFTETLRRSHDNMVREYCLLSDTLSVAALLRMDDEYRPQHVSKEQLGRTFQALEKMLMYIREIQKLTPQEFMALRRVVYRRLGLGVRFGRSLARLPAILFYPLLFVGSPLLHTKTRHAVMYWYARFYEMRYPRRFFKRLFTRWTGVK